MESFHPHFFSRHVDRRFHQGHSKFSRRYSLADIESLVQKTMLQPDNFYIQRGDKVWERSFAENVGETGGQTWVRVVKLSPHRYSHPGTINSYPIRPSEVKWH